ncbi:putative lipoprotein [Bacteriovorax sp. BAL6_X]|uniref:hypothetical protein n=1 Tax=Bacteriovorax sp. BAL6_X TaxID=1201290 RepID=UPI000386D32F|nr:hypothetical protein [Bacteriovorax sp. BAL6_X]EPZ49584.1 putative lipoprotein [Bacteriovorax sp. BAL6_X]
MSFKKIFSIIFFIVLLLSCFNEGVDSPLRAPASIYQYKVISYTSSAIECRGHVDDRDVEGTLLETVPLGPRGQAPINICGEELSSLKSDRIRLY